MPPRPGHSEAMRRAMTPDEAWGRVLTFATKAADDGRRIFTLQERVANTITDVRPESIGRRSDAGTSNSSRIGKTGVLRLWKELARRQGPVSTPKGVYYFTVALMVAAMPDIVQDVGDGKISLSDDPEVAARDRRRTESAKTRAGGCGGGEGPIHRAIKEFIFRQPDVALSSIGGAPFTARKLEWVFATGDRVDVVLTDCCGKVVLVEVKPDEVDDARAPFAQAAKYRVLWNILEERAAVEIRCVVAATRISDALAKSMWRDHDVESVVVRAPRSE